MAEEYVEIVRQLFGSWEPGAIVADRKSGVLIDHTKVHTIDFEGKYYRSRGPLNSGPAPQGQPVIAQAGGSDKGRAFAAKYADTVVAHPKGIDAMKQYRDDVRYAAWRRPAAIRETCKILFLISPIVAETNAEARAKADQRAIPAEKNIDARLAQFGWSTNLDLSDIDLDTPVGQLELSTNGHQSSLCAVPQEGRQQELARSDHRPQQQRRDDRPGRRSRQRRRRRWPRRCRRSAATDFCSICPTSAGAASRRSPMGWCRSCNSAGSFAGLRPRAPARQSAGVLIATVIRTARGQRPWHCELP